MTIQSADVKTPGTKAFESKIHDSRSRPAHSTRTQLPSKGGTAVSSNGKGSGQTPKLLTAVSDPEELSIDSPEVETPKTASPPAAQDLPVAAESVPYQEQVKFASSMQFLDEGSETSNNKEIILARMMAYERSKSKII